MVTIFKFMFTNLAQAYYVKYGDAAPKTAEVRDCKLL